MGTSRREFLKTTGAAGLTAGAFGLPFQGCASNPQAFTVAAMGSRTPKRVIFMVSDGMSMGAMSLSDVYSRRVRGRGTHFHELLQDAASARGLFLTHSLNSLVTDSAAASTAWGSGSRVFNGAINVLPDGRELKPIHELVKEAGFGTGLVTTATITHATPAGFAAVSPERDNEELIASQYLDRVDVLLGGGRQYFDPARRQDGRDLLGDFQSAGYTRWNERSELVGRASAPGRLLGLFGDWVLPYSIDRLHDSNLDQSVPTLAEMTAAALESLAGNPQGFLLQVEAALVDWAAHWNDTATMIHDQLAFDDAIGVSLDFIAEHPETLLVVTSDHGNSNPGLIGMGGNYLEADESFDRIREAKGSYYKLITRIEEGEASSERIADLVEDQFGLRIQDRFAEALALAFAEQDTGEIHVQQRAFTGILAQVLGNHTGIGWTGSTHTEDPTVLVARGPGQEAWGRMMHHTECFGNLAGYYGINHRNPTMTAEEARQFASAPVSRHTPRHAHV